MQDIKINYKIKYMHIEVIMSGVIIVNNIKVNK